MAIKEAYSDPSRLSKNGEIETNTLLALDHQIIIIGHYSKVSWTTLEKQFQNWKLWAPYDYSIFFTFFFLNFELFSHFPSHCSNILVMGLAIEEVSHGGNNQHVFVPQLELQWRTIALSPNLGKQCLIWAAFSTQHKTRNQDSLKIAI